MPLVAGLPAHLAGAIIPIRTHLTCYSQPLRLHIALLCAPLLVWLVEWPFSSKSAPESPNPPCRWLLLRLPMFWCGLGLLLLLLWLSSFSSIGSSLGPYRDLAVVLGLGWCGRMVALGASDDLGVIGLSCSNVAALLAVPPPVLWELQQAWPILTGQPWPVPPGDEIQLGLPGQPGYADNALSAAEVAQAAVSATSQKDCPGARRGGGPWPTVINLSPLGACGVHRGTRRNDKPSSLSVVLPTFNEGGSSAR